MRDWVSGSRRMKWTAGLMMAAWAAGAVCGIASAAPDDLFNAASTALIGLTALAASLVVLWAATQCAPRSLERWTWLLVGSALAVDSVGVVLTFARNYLTHASAPSDGAMAALVLGYLPMAAGLAIAWLNRVVRESRRRLLVRWAVSLGMATVMFGAFVFAFLGPGPSMPFSVTANDVAATMRIFVDCYAILLPAVVCILSALASSENHWSRAWLWIAVGALIWAMADTIHPLIDLPDGASFSIAIWALGAVTMSMGASLVVDFVRYDRGDADGGLEPAREPRADATSA